jgi:hypothetical protein
MWVKAVNPESRIFDTIADGIGSVGRRKLRDAAEVE